MSDSRLLAFYQQALGGVSAVEELLLRDEFLRRLIAAGITIDTNGIFTNLPAPLSIGGVPLSSLVAGDLLYATGASALARLADVAVGQVLISGGVGVAPSWSGALLLSGALDISPAGAGQIKFPSTQNASANANTLDDYAEGTWTPVIGGSGGTSGQTYSSQIGSYVKWGQMVGVGWNVTLSNKGTITGSVQIQGLPFTASAVGLVSIGPVIWVGLNTNWVTMAVLAIASSTGATLFGANAAASSSNTALATADITNTTQFFGSLVYRASA